MSYVDSLMPARHIKALVQAPASLLPVQLPADDLGKAADGFPLHMGDQDRVPGSFGLA